VLPILLLIVLGLIEAGRAIWTQSTLDYAVQAAARCYALGAICSPSQAELVCDNSANTQQCAATKAPGLSFPDPASTFNATTPPCGKQVTASLQFDWLVPEILPYSTTLSASACFPI
jgi:Flp pilus assembly protein TadG